MYLCYIFKADSLISNPTLLSLRALYKQKMISSIIANCQVWLQTVLAMWLEFMINLQSKVYVWTQIPGEHLILTCCKWGDNVGSRNDKAALPTKIANTIGHVAGMRIKSINEPIFFESWGAVV